MKSDNDADDMPKTLLNKGFKSEALPSRHVLNTLTKGDPQDRNMNNYAKASPVNLTGIRNGDPSVYPMDRGERIT